MNSTLAIARREFGTYFNSPVAYVVLGVFLIAAASLFFLVIGGGLFVGGRASLRGFFGMPVRLQQFVGQWIELPESSRCRLGASPETGALGQTAVVVYTQALALSLRKKEPEGE